MRFLSRGNGYTLYLTPKETVLSLAHAGAESVLRMSLRHANPKAPFRAMDPLPGYSNYFHGRDRSQWRTGVPHYSRIRQEGVYPGIDVIYYGNQRQLEYDFVLAPGADPGRIRLRLDGHSGLRIDRDGNLVVRMGAVEVVQKKPLVYQETGGRRQTVDGRYVLTAANEVRFQIAAYDRTRKLIVDPVVSFSTFLGGIGQDDGRGIVLDAQGNIYVTGATTSANFPTLGTIHPKRGDINAFDAYVTKLNPTGNTVLYSTFVGGGGVLQEDGGVSIALDAQGNIYVAGVTISSEFPVTAGAIQRTFGGSVFRDGFVAKINAAGTQLLYATYLGGSDEDFIEGIAVDGDGQAYVTGYTKSTNFPVRNAIQATLRGTDDAFLAKLNPTGTDLLYSTYIGGAGADRAYDLVVDSQQQVYICGETTSADFPAISGYQTTKKDGVDAFVLRMNSTGTSVSLSTFLGGQGKDQAFAIALDSSGGIYVAGETGSNDFPAQSAFQQQFGGFSDAFITKLNANASALVYSTYLGGNVTDGAYDLTVDNLGQAYVIGGTWSDNFPLKDATQTNYGGDFRDAFVAVLGPTGNVLVFSTFMGGSNVDNWENIIDFRGYGGIALDAAKAIFVVGTTASGNFPTTSNGLQPGFGGNTTLGEGDAFIAKIVLGNGGGGGGGGGGGSGNTTTITTFPAGLRYTVDGQFYTASQTFNWAAGEQHTIGTETQQGNSSSRYTFTGWTDGGAISHTVTVGSSATLYVANFSSQHYLTMTAGGGGTVSPASAWYDQGSTFGISASPNPGYTFAGWTGTGTGAVSSTANPALITINGPITQAALFTNGSTGVVPTSYVPVSPCRVMDTRAGQGTSGAFGPPVMSAGSTRTIPIPTSRCTIPGTARAYSVNITVVPAEPLSYLSIYPTGQSRPLVSTLNSFDGRVVANAAIVPAGANGALDVFVTNRTEVIIDVTGYFASAGGLPFHTVTPCRAVDTRNGQGINGAFGPPTMQGNTSRDFPLPASRCSLPVNAQAYSLNATVVPSVALSYLSLWPQGQNRPTVSTLNAPDGSVTANAAIVQAGNAGGVSAYVTDTTDLILDVNGYFGTGGANPLLFTPVAPCRLADTRAGEGKTGQFGPPALQGGTTRTITVPAGECRIPSTARAYSLNITVVPQGSLPYLSIWPAGQSQPVVSTLNSFAGKVLANAAIVPAGAGGAINIFVAATSDVIVDINGYFAPQ